MAETYNLAATPFLFPEGEFKGRLKGVSFRATSATGTKNWFAINCGQFPRVFRKLIPSESADEIMIALMQGEGTEFPGLYQMEQFDHGFHYEWSPVYFEVDPSLRSGGHIVQSA